MVPTAAWPQGSPYGPMPGLRLNLCFSVMTKGLPDDVLQLTVKSYSVLKRLRGVTADTS